MKMKTEKVTQGDVGQERLEPLFMRQAFWEVEGDPVIKKDGDYLYRCVMELLHELDGDDGTDLYEQWQLAERGIEEYFYFLRETQGGTTKGQFKDFDQDGAMDSLAVERAKQ